MCQFEIVNRQMVFKAIRQHGITKRRRASLSCGTFMVRRPRGEKESTRRLRKSSLRGRRKIRQVWCPGSQGKNISRKKEGSIVSDSANWSHKTRTENSLLDLITWKSGL